MAKAAYAAVLGDPDDAQARGSSTGSAARGWRSWWSVGAGVVVGAGSQETQEDADGEPNSRQGRVLRA
jgi:hypothetical protein